MKKYNFNLDEIKSLYLDQKKGLDAISKKDKIKLYRNPFKHKEYMKLYREGKLLKCFNSGNKKFIWRQKCETTKC